MHKIMHSELALAWMGLLALHTIPAAFHLQEFSNE